MLYLQSLAAVATKHMKVLSIVENLVVFIAPYAPLLPLCLLAEGIENNLGHSLV
jgi:hypothetical protein